MTDWNTSSQIAMGSHNSTLSHRRIRKLLNSAKDGTAPPKPSHDQHSHGRSQETALTDVEAFNNSLSSCLHLLRHLVDEIMQWIPGKGIDHPASQSFRPIVLKLDDKLVRLEIWHSDIAFEVYSFSKVSQTAHLDLALTSSATAVLDSLLVRLREVEQTVRGMRSMTEAMSGDGLYDL